MSDCATHPNEVYANELFICSPAEGRRSYVKGGGFMPHILSR
jgi:hypothetical protein